MIEKHTVLLYTFLIGLCLAWITYRLSLARDSRNKRDDAVTKLVESFTPCLDALIQTDCNALYIMTDDAFKIHDSAIRNFCRHISRRGRKKINRAWRQLAYQDKPYRDDMPFYCMYTDNGSPDKRKELRTILVKRIQNIISLAKN
jgi:hypothetical protein